MDLTPDTIIITGGSRGLGRAMALALARHGATLALTGAIDSTALHTTAEECRAAGAAAVLPLAIDVTDPAACQTGVKRIEKTLGPIGVLVNNAGLGMRAVSETYNTTPHPFWQTDPKAWRDIIDTNVNGAFNMARATVPAMIGRGHGQVINISTSDQTMVRKGYAPYGPSKAALEAASRIWAADLDGTGVTVNVLLPGGAADTDLLPPSVQKKGADGNLLSPDVMARPILWLCSPAARSCNGQRFIGRLWGDAPSPAPDAISAPSPRPAIM